MIRKLLTVIEETHREGTLDIRPATRKAAAIAVVENPFAGRHADDLADLIAIGEMLGGLLGERAVQALGTRAAPFSTATRSGAPSLGCRMAAACSSSPSSPTMAALP